MARTWMWMKRWGLGAGLALAVAACGPGGLIPPTPTAPPSTGPIGLLSDPLVTVGTLQARAIMTFAQNGWVHMVQTVSHDVDPEPYSSLPDGTPIPAKHLIETWANITGAQVVTQRVVYLRTLSGQILQTGAYNEGILWNSATGAREAQTAAAAGAFDLGFAANLGEYKRAGATITQALAQLDGAEVIEILVDHPFARPSLYEDYTQEVAGQRVRASYDPHTGQLKQLEWVMRLADGSERVYGLWQITLEANATPPESVLAALDLPLQ